MPATSHPSRSPARSSRHLAKNVTVILIASGRCGWTSHRARISGDYGKKVQLLMDRAEQRDVSGRFGPILKAVNGRNVSRKVAN